MPLYPVTAPNGLTYNVPAPQGASQQDVINILLAQHPEAAEPREKNFVEQIPGVGGALNYVTDTALSAVSGFVSPFASVASVFGANNPVASGLGAASKYLEDARSSAAKISADRAAAIRAQGFQKGIGSGLASTLYSMGIDPLGTTASITGGALPYIGIGMLTGGAGDVALGTEAALAAARAAATRTAVAETAFGGASGAGDIKQRIYGATKEEFLKQGLPEDQAEAAAQKAQAYGGSNTGMIALGGVIGGLAANMGIPKQLGEAIAGRVVSKIVPDAVAESLGRATLKGAAEAGGISAIQGGQGQLAQNLALQGAGSNVSTWQSVVQAAAESGIPGAIFGGALGAYNRNKVTPEPIGETKEAGKETDTPPPPPPAARETSKEALTNITADPTNPDVKAAAVTAYTQMGLPLEVAKTIVENHADRVIAANKETSELSGQVTTNPQQTITPPDPSGQVTTNPQQTITPPDPSVYLNAEHARLTGLLQNPEALTTYAAQLGEHPEVTTAQTRERVQDISARLGIDVPDIAKTPTGAADVMAISRQIEAQKNLLGYLRAQMEDPAYTADRVASGEHPDQVAYELSNTYDTAKLDLENLNRVFERATSESPTVEQSKPVLPFPDQAESEAPNVKYMAGRRAKDTETGSLFGEAETPTAGQGALDKREQYQQQLLASTREERTVAQEQASQQAGEVGQARAAKAEQNTRDTLDDLEFALRAQHPDNANYQIVYNKDQTFPFKLMGSDGVLRFESRTLDDFQNQIYEGMKPSADEPLTPYTDTPSGARTENTPSPYNEEVQRLTGDIDKQASGANPAITPNDRAELFSMLGNNKAIQRLEAQYREAESAYRNAGSAVERKAAQDTLAQAGENLRNTTQRLITDPVRSRLNEIVENRQDEQAGAKQRIGNAKVQERLGQMEGKPTAPEVREQREAAIDLKEATPQKYRAGEKEAGGPPKLVSADEVQKMADDITKGWKSDAKVNVVQSEADLPPEIQRAIERDNAHGALGLVGPDGTVHLIADNMHSVEDGKAALFHETLGHLGLEKLFRGNLDSALEAMYRGNKKLRDETDAWRKQYPDAYKDDPNPLARAVEEILAGRSEAGKIDASLFQRIASIVKNFARRMGFKGDMTDGEVNAILSMAHDRMVSGEKESAVVKGLRYMTAWHGSPHDFDRFSTEHMGTGEGAQAFGWGLYFADRKGVAESYRKEGKLYQVDIAPGDDKFLSWDKPLYEQSDHVKDALRHMGVDPEAERDAKYPTTGADLYAQLRRQLKGKEAASKALLAAGIEGNKYLDANSRGPSSENPSHNYVVFNDNNVNITNKYMRPRLPEEVSAKLEEDTGEISRGLSVAQNTLDPRERVSGLGNAIRAHTEDGMLAALKANENALHDQFLETLLKTFPTSGIVGWKGEEIPALRDIQDRVAEMHNMKHNLLKYADTIAKDVDAYVRKNGSEGMARAQVVLRINEVTPEDFAGARTAQEAIHNDNMYKYIKDKINNYKTDDPVTLEQYNNAAKERTLAVRDAFNTWDKLGPEGQELYGRVRDYFKNMYDASVALLDKRIQEFPDKAAAKKVLEETRRNMELNRGDKLTDAQKAKDPYWMLPQGLLPKDYFPFLRYGKYWLRVAENAGEGREREFHTFNSALERDAAKKAIAKKYGINPRDSSNIEVGNNIADLQDKIQNQSGMLGRIFEILNKAKDDTPNGMTNIRDLSDSIYQVYLMSMPERSIRRQFIHADEVTGMSMDVLRNFSSKAVFYANNLSKLAYADSIHKLVKGAYENNRVDKTKPNDQVAKDETFIRAMATRAQEELNPTEQSNQLNVINRIPFLYFLSSAKSALTHLIDVPRRMFPYLGAEHGYDAAIPKFAKYMNVFRALGTLHTSDDGSVHVVAPNIGDSAMVKNNPLLRRAYDALSDRNVFGGIAANFIENESRRPKGDRSIPMRAIDATTFAMGSAFRYGESLSRQVGSMMAFELEHDRLMATEKPTTSDQKADIFNRAIKFAVDTVNNKMGNYSNFERPPVMKGNIAARTLGLFKLWSVHQTAYLMGTVNRLVASSLRNEISELESSRSKYTGQTLDSLNARVDMLKQQMWDRRVKAAKEFGGVMMMTGLMAGVKGLPLNGLITSALYAINNTPEDEARRRSLNPFGATDPENWFRDEWIPQHFGNPSVATADGQVHRLSDILMNGPLNELTGSQYGSAASMGDMWFRGSAEGSTTKGTIGNMILSNIAAMSMVDNISTMADDFSKGQIERGLEVGLPSLISGPLKANRLNTEGARNMEGDQLLSRSEISDASIVAQALGISPTRLKQLQDSNREDLQNRQAAKLERDTVLKNYYRVQVEGGTYAEATAAEKAIEAFNAKYPVPGFLIDNNTLRSGIKDYAVSRAENYRGVVLNKKNIGYEGYRLQNAGPAPSGQ